MSGRGRGLFIAMTKSGDIFPTRDPVKKAIFIPKLLLESTNFWPEKRSKFTKITNWVMLTICILIEVGQIVFVASNIKNITKIAPAMSTVSTTFQAITKMSVLYFYSQELKEVLSVIWYAFWPATFGGVKIFRRLETYNKMLIGLAAVMFLSGGSFAFGFLSSPLRNGVRVLPFEAVYPFDWSRSPLYELIYIMEWMTNIAFIVVGILGHDFLFVGICSNIIAQYILLSNFISKLGTNHVCHINKHFAENSSETDQNRTLLITCIDHHNMLASVTAKTAEIFSFSAFVQLLSSVLALCVAALIMTFAEIDVTLFTAVAAYLFGHLLQLFMFCALGNEVIHYAGQLSDAAFSSEWYKVEDLRLKKDLVFVVMRMQKKVQITAMGIKTLDFGTFIKVLRLSFSFYTMLSNITENK